MFFFGLVTICQGLVHSYSGLLATRMSYAPVKHNSSLLLFNQVSSSACVKRACFQEVSSYNINEITAITVD